VPFMPGLKDWGYITYNIYSCAVVVILRGGGASETLERFTHN
jgi:hypothetical protein